MVENKHGPLWQLEQNLKTHRTNAQTFRNDAQAYLVRAEQCDKDGDEYEEAIKKLKAAEAKS